MVRKMITTKTVSSCTSDDKYTVTINQEAKTVHCDCMGFIVHGRCKHILFYKDTVRELLYKGYQEQVIDSFKNCRELILKLIEKNPLLMYSYNELVYAVHKHRMYSTETITRAYRKLREEGEIIESVDLEMRHNETEKVMHDINKWSPDVAHGNQSKLLV